MLLWILSLSVHSNHSRKCFAAADDAKLIRLVLPQPAAVTKPTYPGSYEAGRATSHEVKNSPDWEEGGRVGTPAASTGREAFVLGNDDAAARLTAFMPEMLQGS